MERVRRFAIQSNAHCMEMLSEVQPYLVEVAYFFFFLSRHMTLPLFQEYVQSEFYKQSNLKASAIEPFYSGNGSSLYNIAHRESTLAILSLQIAEGLPALITVIILGAVSDRTSRRKILLWMPSLGGILHSLIYILILYTSWTLDGLFMASALRGLSGSMTAFLAGSTFFAINTTQREKRSSRLAIQESLNGIAYAIANIMVGYWLQASGFHQPFWFTLICGCIAFLISFFLVKEVKVETSNPNRYDTENCCIDTFKPMGKFFRCKERKLLIMWLAILAFQSYAWVHLGQINTLVLYFTGSPYHWQSHKVGVFLSVAMGVASIGVLFTPPVLRNWFSDIHITFGGLFSKAVGTLWLAVVQNEVVIYFAIFLLVLELIPFPMLRAVVANSIDTADQGSLFALMHCGEGITYFLAPFMFQSLYADSIDYFTGFVFVLSVILLIIPVGFVIAIKFLTTSQPGEYERMEGETEMTGGEELPLPTDHEDKNISVIPVTTSENTEVKTTAQQNVIRSKSCNEEATEPVAV
ncbi:proton-coupled folate transporter-like [Saccostrea echinata]|uniref:proton-coupled folate transporter-like n=1 Tax=Saccostrea echinata TaxID=191078 RepID=UPI002A81D350|nr:proton-coupled folate transporter-like [Saccostrea echinata]